MPRISISLTSEFLALVRQYAAAREITQSAAFTELAQAGWLHVTGNLPPPGGKRWGGSPEARSTIALDLERMELAIRGLPPLTDDDE